MDALLERILRLADEKKKEEGLSDAKIEKALGLPIHAFNKWSTGQSHSYVKPKYLNMLADYFGVSVPYLIGGADISPIPQVGDGLSDVHKRLMNDIPNWTQEEAAFVESTLMLLRAKRQSQDSQS